MFTYQSSVKEDKKNSYFAALITKQGHNPRILF